MQVLLIKTRSGKREYINLELYEKFKVVNPLLNVISVRLKNASGVEEYEIVNPSDENKKEYTEAVHQILQEAFWSEGTTELSVQEVKDVIEKNKQQEKGDY